MMTVYESAEPGSSNVSDMRRFEESLTKLSMAGITIHRVICSGPSDFDPEGEALDLFLEEGSSALPITEYDGVVIWDGTYPDDQTLVDFLDVPDGTLSVNRQQPPSINDLAPACTCGPRR